MHQLNNDQLIACYLEALKLKLDKRFLNLLLIEINKRNLSSVLDVCLLAQTSTS
jgi:hypothetical protein